MLTVDLRGALPFLPAGAYDQALEKLPDVHRSLEDRSCLGADFTGWLDLPENMTGDELARINSAAKKIQADSQALVVIGVGGSSLGARAAIEYLTSPNYNLLKKDTPDIYFAGNNLSAAGLEELLLLLEGRDFSLNVVSKSGTTTEPAVAFRVLLALLEKRYGMQGADRRVYATTDARRGALYETACLRNWERFVIPDDVGGRYSVLTAVGLLPMAAAGCDIASVLAGARAARSRLAQKDSDNPAWRYAAIRNALFKAGKSVELLACYEPCFKCMTEWYKQLFGESEGKEHTGLFPAGADFTGDLHSLGQFIQQGSPILFETAVRIENPRGTLRVPQGDDLDGLSYLAGRRLSEINGLAFEGVRMAHIDGGVPVVVINTPEISEFSFGELIYFFEFSCALSGGLLGVNPFDQPGVEDYKRNLFALLGKPGFEHAAGALRDRLERDRRGG